MVTKNVKIWFYQSLEHGYIEMCSRVMCFSLEYNWFFHSFLSFVLLTKYKGKLLVKIAYQKYNTFGHTLLPQPLSTFYTPT